MAKKREKPDVRGLDAALNQIEKQFGKGAIMKLDPTKSATAEGISTGALSLDLALGGRGVPRRRVVELYGPEASGKTTLALHIIAQAQKTGGVAAFIDAEHALDPVWARRVGVNLEELLVSQPEWGEQALEITELLVRSNSVDVIVIDSVAALVPRTELEGEMGDQQVGVQARLMSQAMRKLAGCISRSRAVVIFINQIRMKIGVTFGNPETTPGGRALKFYTSVRIDVRKISTIKQGEEVVGLRARAKVVKNKVAPPFRQAEFDILHDHGINYEGDIIDLAVADQVIDRSGTWLSYGDVRLGQGRDKATVLLQENPDLAEAIKHDILVARGVIQPGAPPAEKKSDTDADAEAGADAGADAGTDSSN